MHNLFFLIFVIFMFNPSIWAASAGDEGRGGVARPVNTAGADIEDAGGAGFDATAVIVRDFRTLRPFPTFTRSAFPSVIKEDGIFTEPYKPVVVLPLSSEAGVVAKVDVPIEASSVETVLRRIISGKDGRRPIINPANQWPYRVIAQVSSKYDGHEFGGTGILVGPRHVLTVGHNLFSNRLKKWANTILVRFSFDGPGFHGMQMPFEQQQVLRAYTYKRWVEALDPDFDIALFVLEDAKGSEIGWHGLASLKVSPPSVHIAGYPLEVKKEDIVEPSEDAYRDYLTSKAGPFGQMWDMASGSHGIMVSPNKLYYQIDTSSGQSGSGVWYETSDHLPYVIGVHAYGEKEHGKGNYGVRITAKKMHDLVEWISSTFDVEVPSSTHVEPSTAVVARDDVSAGAGGSGASSVAATAVMDDTLTTRSGGTTRVLGAESSKVHAGIMSTYDLAYLGNKFALKRLQEEADKGDVIAQGNMIILSLTGDVLDLNKDKDKARYYLTHAVGRLEEEVSRNNPYAQGILGWIYASGVIARPARGIELLTAAASKNVAMAEHYLGMFYFTGRIVPRDVAEAIRWITRAADHGHSKAQKRLGELYRHGTAEIPKNPAEAEKWLKKAVEQDDPMAKLKLAGLYIDLDAPVVASASGEFSPHFFEIMRLAKETAEVGISEGQYTWAMFWEKTEDGGKGCKEAIELYKKAAEQGNIPSMLRLIEIYGNGEGVPKDEAEAEKWRSMAISRSRS